jgi:4,5-dihydroxyphthalate decarboxylase
MSRLNLTIGISEYDHVRDIQTGRVPVEGCDVNVINFEIEEVFHRFTLEREWEVSEMSMAKYLAQIAGDRPDITAIPVFPSRMFRLSNIYINADAGIKTPEDLRGKRIGTPEWAQTASVYTRGWLVDHIGIPLSEIDWRQAGASQPGRIEKVKLKLPEGVTVTPEPTRSLSEMLVKGDLDAAFSAHAPQSFLDGHPKVKQLFPDYQAAEQEYFEQTGIFPIMHLIAIRKDVIDANPWVAGNLYTAFEKAKARAIHRARETAASRYPIPWAAYYAEKHFRGFGTDYFPYGIEPNRKTLEAAIKWCFEQGIIGRRLKVEDLFPASMAGSFKI